MFYVSDGDTVAFSCTVVTEGGRTESEDLADRILNCHEFIALNLDYVFQVDKYLAAEDSVQRQDVLYKYFENSELVYDTTTGILYVNKYRGPVLSIETGGKALGPDNRVWRVTGIYQKPWGGVEEYTFDIRIQEDGRYGLSGTVIANRFYEYQLMYADVDLVFDLGWKDMPYSHPDVSMSVRETATYSMDGTVDVFVGESYIKEKGTPEFRCTFNSVYSYDPKEYIGSEPIFAGGSYFQRGEIRSIVSYDDRQDEYLNLYSYSGTIRMEYGKVD